MKLTLSNHQTISNLIEFYLTQTKDLDNTEIENLLITNASLASKLEN